MITSSGYYSNKLLFEEIDVDFERQAFISENRCSDHSRWLFLGEFTCTYIDAYASVVCIIYISITYVSHTSDIKQVIRHHILRIHDVHNARWR